MNFIRLLAVPVLALSLSLLSAAPQAAGTKKAPAKATTSALAGPKAGAAKKAEPLDINTASEEDLKNLPNVGPVTAKKIVDGRPYKGKDDLLRKKIVNAATYAKIKDQVVAKQSK